MPFHRHVMDSSQAAADAKWQARSRSDATADVGFKRSRASTMTMGKTTTLLELFAFQWASLSVVPTQPNGPKRGLTVSLARVSHRSPSSTSVCRKKKEEKKPSMAAHSRGHPAMRERGFSPAGRPILFVTLHFLFLFTAAAAPEEEKFTGELLLRPLPDRKALAHFHFRSSAPPAASVGQHHHLFPKAISQLVRAPCVHLHSGADL